MKNVKLLNFVILSLVLILGTTAQTCNKKTKNQVNTQTAKPAPNPTPTGAEMKIIADGSNSKVEKPFIFVALEQATYAQLQKLVENLPSVTKIDFEKTAVVAAFAGTKNTGGYSVEIKNTGEKVSVSVAAPPKDAIVTQALTAPFKVALVPIETENSLILDVSEDWKSATQSYKISSGEFEYSGGLAFRQKKFGIEGTINFWQFDDLATFDFNLTGKGTDKNMKLDEIASGIIKGNKVDLARLNAGSFSENPKPPIKVSGTMMGDKLILTFEPLPTSVADGFSASGKLEAVKIK